MNNTKKFGGRMNTRTKQLPHVVRLFALLALLLPALAVVPQPEVARAAGGIEVNTATDEDTNNGNCSLREAIIASNTDADYNGCTRTDSAPYTITFAGDYTIQIGSSGENATLPTIDTDVVIDGGTNDIVIDGEDNVRVFAVNQNGIDVTLKNLTIENGSASIGAGVKFDDGSLTIDNCTFNGNKATSTTGTSRGGAIYAGSGTDNLTITGSHFNGNQAISTDNGSSSDALGGAIDVASLYIETLTITDSHFNGNQTSTINGASHGGAIRVSSSVDNVVIEDTIFAGNKIVSGSGSSGGGALYTESPDNQVSDTGFVNNEGFYRGGGIFVDNGEGTVVISDTRTLTDTFVGNTAGNAVNGNGEGGAIYAYDVKSVSLNGLNFKENSADEQGGAIYANHGLSIDDTLLEANTAGDTDSTGERGGAIYHYGSSGSSVTIYNSKIYSNTARGEGGGLYVGTAGTVTISSTEIISNSAKHGGGGIETTSALNIYGGTFEENRVDVGLGLAAPGGGAILLLSSGDSVISGTTFVNNWANHTTDPTTCYGGGAISKGSSGELDIRGAWFESNRNNTDGGALGVRDNSGTVLISTSVFSGNMTTDSTLRGGAIHNCATLEMVNSTLVNNKRDTALDGYYDRDLADETTIGNSTILDGLESNATDTHLLNTVITNSDDGVDDCTVASLTTNTNNFVEDGTCDAMYSGDPMLEDVGDEGYAMPKDGSHLVDSGDNATCEDVDQRGVARPADGDGDGLAVCDIGSIEGAAAPANPPDAVDDTAMVERGVATPIDVLANDETGSTKAITPTVVAVGVAAQGTITYTDEMVYYTSSIDFAGTDSFTYTIEDAGGLSDTAWVTVTVQNESPTLSISSETISYTKRYTPKAVAGGATLEDDGEIASITVQITDGYVSGEDILKFTGTTTMTGSFDAETGMLTLTPASGDSASPADFQAALRGVTFKHTGTTPGTTSRTLTFIVTDDAGDTDTATRDMSVYVPPTTTSKEIGSEGGSLTSGSGTIGITIPSNTAEDGTNISIIERTDEPTGLPNIPGISIVPADHFDIVGTDANSDTLESLPGTFEIVTQYTDEDLEALGIDDENTLMLAVYNERLGQWELLETTIDPDANTATAMTSLFGTYALISVDPMLDHPIELDAVISSSGSTTATLQAVVLPIDLSWTYEGDTPVQLERATGTSTGLVYSNAQWNVAGSVETGITEYTDNVMANTYSYRARALLEDGDGNTLVSVPSNIDTVTTGATVYLPMVLR